MSSHQTSSSNHFPAPKLCQKFTIKEFKLWEKNFKVACVSRECYEILTGVEVAPIQETRILKLHTQKCETSQQLIRYPIVEGKICCMF